MDNATNKNEKRKAALKWIFIIAVNVLIAVMVIVSSVIYSVQQNDSRYSEKEDRFSSALDAMGQTAYFNLHTEQVFCDNWSTYINPRNDSEVMKLSTIEDFLVQVNSDSQRVTVQIANYDSLKGIYVTKDEVEDKSVDYSGVADRVKDAFEESLDCQKGSNVSHLHITLPFVNPVDNKVTLGFCHKITAIDDMIAKDNEQKDFILVRVLQVSEFYGKWLPPSFNKAKLALVNHNGDFVVHFNSFDGSRVETVQEDNFFTYLTNKTDAGQSTVDALEKKFNTVLDPQAFVGQTDEFGGELRCANAGREGFYSYHRLKEGEEWALVGFILREDLNVINLDTTLAIIVIVGFAILMVIDFGYIAVINKRLKKSMEDIKYANVAKTRFLSSMSHDIRTPMNAIIGMTAIAAKRIDDKKQVEECLHQITRASNHLLTLINDVLDISKVESGKFSLNPTVFSLAELMGNIITITQPTIKEKEMEFEIHARNVKYEFIFADELRINQILINLISNAVKYTPEKGKVVLGLREETSEQGSNVARLIFTVTDTGIGISEEFMKSMYDTFTRDIDTRINTIQGAGLGLAITKQMVDLMNGKIEVASKVGEGTTFTVTLDLPIAEKMTDELVLPPLRTLIADDDEVFLESADDTLKSLGLDTDLASNGAEAVRMVAEKHDKGIDYHCIIVDWKMPDMDGIETVRAIRAKVGDDVPVIIISAYDWTEIEQEAIKAGADGFIAKPLFRSTVYNKLNELLKLNKDKKTVKEDTGEDLSGLHLLIAEDNDVNWEIIQVMLEFHGITAERAVNGQVCVDKLNAAEDGTYDAVLMDIQMPVMNGNDATRAIRKAEREYVRNVPVIAMTADAFAEDIIACKEAGMNGHVAKPLDMQKLLKELRAAIRNGGKTNN